MMASINCLLFHLRFFCFSMTDDILSKIWLFRLYSDMRPWISNETFCINWLPEGGRALWLLTLEVQVSHLASTDIQEGLFSTFQGWEFWVDGASRDTGQEGLECLATALQLTFDTLRGDWPHHCWAVGGILIHQQASSDSHQGNVRVH